MRNRQRPVKVKPLLAITKPFLTIVIAPQGLSPEELKARKEKANKERKEREEKENKERFSIGRLLIEFIELIPS